ncbi:MAG: hypothetical protein J7L20_00990 [Thermoplasmata archaeon]|nr:hypothetical protein [Thermoplasmata archaeon]
MRGVIHLLTAGLLATTALLGVATAVDEKSILEEQKKHVTPEEWAEIEELLAENEKYGRSPDLEITVFKKTTFNRVRALVHNAGDGYAHVFYTAFHVQIDNEWKCFGKDYFWLGLRAGRSKWAYSEPFPYEAGTYYCRAWADAGNWVQESNEDNNQAFGWFTFY